MKVAKSYKIVLLLLTLAMLITSSLCFGGVKSAKADAVSPASYLDMTGSVNAEYVDGNLSFTVNKDNKISFKHDLVISDMAMELYVPKETSVYVTLSSDSFYVNGNKNAEGSFDKIIDNKISIKRTDGDTVYVTINDQTGFDANLTNDFITLSVKVENSFVSVSADGGSVTETDNYRRIKDIDNRAVADVEFSFDFTAPDATNTFKIKSVDQKASDPEGKYKQTFVKDAEGNIKEALPRVTLNDSFYKKNVDGTYEAIKVYKSRKTLSLNSHSILAKGNTAELSVGGNNNEIFAETGVEHPRTFRFIKTGDNIGINVTKKVDGEDVVVETYSVKVYEEGAVDMAGTSDIDAPEYIAFNTDDEAVAGFLNALYEKCEDKTKHTITLTEKVEIPSLKDLVHDNITPYEELTYKVNYKTRMTENSQSKMTIEFNDLDNYLFYVSYKDANDNEMNKDQFIKINNEGEANEEIILGDYVFDFVVKDTKVIDVKAPAKQGNGYKGVTYKASKFDIDATGCNLDYKLYYNSDLKAEADAEGWKEIPKFSSVSKDYKGDNFNYDELKAINYDGNLKFTPTKIGSYKIVCTATSEVASRTRTASADSLIRVESEPKTVKVDNHWLENNVWSVVFLSIGTVSFIALLVLIFIKPKDKNSSDEN